MLGHGAGRRGAGSGAASRALPCCFGQSVGPAGCCGAGGSGGAVPWHRCLRAAGAASCALRLSGGPCPHARKRGVQGRMRRAFFFFFFSTCNKLIVCGEMNRGILHDKEA